jgi:hypothetical protein
LSINDESMSCIDRSQCPAVQFHRVQSPSACADTFRPNRRGLKVTKVARFNIAKSFAAFGVAASAMLASAPAQAVPVQADLQAYRGLTIQVNRGLNFGSVVLGTATGAEVQIAATLAGTRTVPVGDVRLVPSFPGISAEILLTGEPDTLVSVSGVQSFNLNCITPSCGGSSGDVVNILPTSNMPGLGDPRTVRLSNPGGAADGAYTFYIGGTASVPSGMHGGSYRGTMNVTADYQ